MRIPFGKHRGLDLSEVPDDYFEWPSSLGDLREPLRSGVEHEKARRERMNSELNSAPSALPRELTPLAEEMVTAGLKVMALRHHPDAGGTHEAMVSVNEAARLLRALIRGGAQ